MLILYDKASTTPAWVVTVVSCQSFADLQICAGSPRTLAGCAVWAMQLNVPGELTNVQVTVYAFA